MWGELESPDGIQLIIEIQLRSFKTSTLDGWISVSDMISLFPGTYIDTRFRQAPNLTIMREETSLWSGVIVGELVTRPSRRSEP